MKYDLMYYTFFVSIILIIINVQTIDTSLSKTLILECPRSGLFAVIWARLKHGVTVEKIVMSEPNESTRCWNTLVTTRPGKGGHVLAAF